MRPPSKRPIFPNFAKCTAVLANFDRTEIARKGRLPKLKRARELMYDALQYDFYQGNNFRFGRLFMEYSTRIFSSAAERAFIDSSATPAFNSAGRRAQSEARHDGELTHPQGMAAGHPRRTGGRGDGIGGCRSASRTWSWSRPWPGLGRRWRAAGAPPPRRMDPARASAPAWSAARPGLAALGLVGASTGGGRACTFRTGPAREAADGPRGPSSAFSKATGA